MPAVARVVPDHLVGRPVTTAECRAAGLSAEVLRRRLTPMLRGVWWCGDAPPTLTDWIAAALLVIRHDAVVSHLTALRLLGVDIGPMTPVHLTHTGLGRTQLPMVVLHRRRGPIEIKPLLGFRVTSAVRAFVDSATLLSLRDLVRVGDALVRTHRVSRTELVNFCVASTLDGARRAQWAARLVCDRVDSFMETDVRLLLGFAGLPRPECNVEAYDTDGTFLGRGDLVFAAFKIVVEYDGWHHERSAEQRRKDLRRRERFEAAGWTVIVVVSTDLDDPLGIVRRVHRALVRRGWRGEVPDSRHTWDAWTRACATDSAT